MSTQLMTLDQAIEKRLASMRQAEAEHQRQIEEEARRREEETRRAVEWLCTHLQETEGIEIEPSDFDRAWMDGVGCTINVNYQIGSGGVKLQTGIHFSEISKRYEIVLSVGKPWLGSSGGVYSEFDTFVDAVIYAGRLKR